ncbi:Protein-export membrane protein SecG [uncultured bacterium]|nr:Protein-export membrane protein SecG [uncultured bacterium]
MFTLVLIIHVLVSLVIVAAVLLQAGKGASIGSTFGGSSSSSQTIFGSAGPATLLAKVTYGCAAVFMITSIALTYMSTRQRTESIMQDVPAATAPAPSAPVAPPQAPSTVPSAPESAK